MKTLLKNTPLLLFVAGILLFGCEREPAESTQTEEPANAATTARPTPLRATATLTPTQGNTTTGSVSFTEVDGGVRVVAGISGLRPGKHGFHLHENGDCSAPDGTSAGGHYNPQDSPHGAPDAPADQRHAGDLGNLEAGADGTAAYDRADPVLTLDGPASIIGRAVIVHAGEDDFQTQPTGAAGARLACGVIEREAL